MKKILLILMCLFYVFPVLGQEAPEKLTKAQRHRLQLVQYQDDMLDFLLQTPFELRQYIFPMLSEKKSVPKKIKTHPDILVWKGKRPTRVAKKFANDSELLEFLPAQFYIYLAPEMWPDEIGETLPKEGNPNQVLLNFLRSANTDTIASDELLNFKRGLAIFNENLTNEQKQILQKKDKPIYLKDFFVFSNPTIEEALKAKRLSPAPIMAKKIDTLAQAYRLYTKGKIPPTGPEQKLVKEYFSLIPMLFNNSVFEVLIDNKLYSD